MRNDDRNPNLQQDLPEQRVYRLTADGREAKVRPSGRVSRGFLRLIAVLTWMIFSISLVARVRYGDVAEWRA